jgi:acetoin:2,6-dichlorophenolindophenol oxidoreductase subunit beta
MQGIMTNRKLNNNNMKHYSYGSAICAGFEYLLEKYPEVFVIGQGLWSPWYVGNSMNDLDKKFGVERIVDSPVSESAITGIGVGASLSGMRAIVVHPRMDFMLYAMDALVNQAAKWSHMTGGQAHPSVTVRAIINRGGEQGAQHSQALHSWFAHVPGLRVVMPSTVADARDLLIASVLCQDPVLYIDDRWLYDQEDEISAVEEIDLVTQTPCFLNQGNDITIVASGYASLLAKQSAMFLQDQGIFADVIDLRVLNPLDSTIIKKSVQKTRHLLVIDSGTKTAGFSAEIITCVCEEIGPNVLRRAPKRITLPDSPAPTSRVLENKYYTTVEDVISGVKEMLA